MVTGFGLTQDLPGLQLNVIRRGIRRMSMRMDIRMGHFVLIESSLCCRRQMLERLVFGMMLLLKTLA